jgi:AcrR family transcriptional regulator
VNQQRRLAVADLEQVDPLDRRMPNVKITRGEHNALGSSVPRSSSRPYHSPRRQQSAHQTRLAVLTAARQQFIERGFAGASLADIAAQADVSLATVKLIAGTKAQLLVAVVQSAIPGDQPGLPVVERDWWRQMLAQPAGEEVLRHFATRIGAALEQQAALFEVVYAAAASEPELADLDRRASLGRWDDLRQVAERLRELGAVRETYAVNAATDVIWALASPQVFRLLVSRREWSLEHWQAWLLDSLRLQLLKPT